MCFRHKMAHQVCTVQVCYLENQNHNAMSICNTRSENVHKQVCLTKSQMMMQNEQLTESTSAQMEVHLEDMTS